MPQDVYYGKTLRKSFARSKEIQDMPNLLEIQKESYQWFLKEGLREVFADVDSVTDYSGNLELSFVDYSMNEKPKYSEEECKARDATYAAPLKVGVRLRNRETEEIKEQEIFMGDFPLMTDSGTFIINGAERVIVSQIVRSPGIYYDKKVDKTAACICSTTIIPYHGAWLEYETDLNDVFYARIDKNRKIPVTWLLRAVGRRDEDKPYPAPAARAALLPTSRSARCSATTNISLRPSKRMPAFPARNPSLRFTVSCVLEIPRPWTAQRLCLQTSFSTSAATTFPA